MRWILSAVLGFVAVANAEAGKKVTWTFGAEPNPEPSPFVFVAPVPVKPTVNIDPGHTCARCGTQQTRINEQAGGTHSHKCSSCGNTWWHADPEVKTTPVPVVAAQPQFQFQLPQSSGGCPGGVCPTSGPTNQFQPFGGRFRR